MKATITGIVLVVIAQVMQLVMYVVMVGVQVMKIMILALETALLVKNRVVYKTVLMMIAVQQAGLVMALLTVKNRHMAVTLLAMMKMVVTALMTAVTPVVVKLAVTVHMTLHLMDLNAVIQQQLSMV